MECRELENVIAEQGLEPLPGPARQHALSCSSCRALVADLTAIVSVANKLPAEIEPPARLWPALRNRLEIEGLIKESPEILATAAPVPWFSSWRQLFTGRTLATAGVGLVLAVSALVLTKTQHPSETGSLAPSPAAAKPLDSSPVLDDSAMTATRAALTKQEQVVRGMELVGDSPVDASLSANLKKVDEFIGVCEQRLKEEPRDELARQYLYEAYQQKAELLAAMMDRGRSVN